MIENYGEPVYLPFEAFKPGTYYWTWSTSSHRAEVFWFEVPESAVVVEVPPAAEWVRRMPADHPRLFTRSEHLPGLREARNTHKAVLWQQLKTDADAILAERHETEEPPTLPDRNADYQAWFKIWYGIMWGTRGFVKGAATLSLAYLASGEKSYAVAACQRMASVAKWDPEGGSYLGHNDEAHMSVIWHGPSACDWAWDQFTDDERALVIAQYRDRGRITFDHMRNRGYYGVTRFDSHAGREIVFLANVAFVFHDHIPEALEWLDWLRPVLCGVWPIWAEDDGAWAEGLSYGTAYVEIMTMFASALKHGAGIDLYRRPFWQNHTEWRRLCLPPYAEWMGFGDHSERWGYTWLNNANLIELIDRETGACAMGDHVAAFRKEAEHLFTPPERQSPGVSAQLYLTSGPETPAKSDTKTATALRVFPEVGWAVIRTNLHKADQDIAFIFRSSPYGAVSHSHANNNDFILHVAGKVMAMPSGYYAGYGSDHHAHWVWHTKSHNCITLSDAPQIMRSHDSRGMVDHGFEDGKLIYFRGLADASYQDRAERCRRHICFLRAHNSFLLVDEFVARPDISSSLQWNIHSWNPFTVDHAGKHFAMERDGSTVSAHILHHQNGYFTMSDGWDPPPTSVKANEEWRQQYHLRYTPSGLEPQRNLGVLLCPGHDNLSPAQVTTERTETAEIAHIGADTVLVGHESRISHGGIDVDAPIMLNLGDIQYVITDTGVQIN